MRAFLIITLFLGFGYTTSAQDTLSTENKTIGTASFYAKKFNGRKTSSGEKFSSDSLTAAHKKLKFGTYVLVRNLKNDSTVIVKINDRLPQKSKRSLDLTLRAAKQLNFVKSGLTKVEITVLDSLKK
jgi:rare lipoprotein A